MGEQIGLGVLRDFSRTYNEMFSGFELKRFNGEMIRIVDGDFEDV